MTVGALATGQGTVLRWGGPASEPMIRVTDSRHLHFRDLRLFGNDSARPSAGIEFRKESPDNQGTNSNLTVSDCHFGRWPWTSSTNRGLMSAGILFNGISGDNDQFWIARSSFEGSGIGDTIGLGIQNSQSVWGSLTDCVFTGHRAGFTTAASCTLVNPQFNWCDVDLELTSTARVDVVGWQSEHSRKIASLAPSSTLRVRGGVIHVDPDCMVPGSEFINAYPSSVGQTIALRDMTITYVGGSYPSPSLPRIRFGPANHGYAHGSGFLLSVENCSGLRPSMCELALPIAGADSRGTVEWHSRADAIHYFRNELRGTGAPGTRSSLDTASWDPPIPGSS